jgi:EAL domain-containing protein (putative c-di-GMP-specific phosphodiesterase class I)
MRGVQDAVDRFQPDAIVLDLMMPDMDGVEVLRYLADHDSRAGVIISSGGEPKLVDSTVRLARTLGLKVLGSLAKPFSLLELEQTLRRALRIRARVSEADLERAVRQGELVPYFQAKVSASEPSRIVGAEVLARWKHPEHGILNPVDFISLAETTGLITELTLALLESALRQTRAHGFDAPLSVNLSPVSLDERHLPDELERHCRDAGAAPDSVVFEVTEGVASRDFSELMTALTRLRLKGFAISMDDYGTGYSSLIHLVRLPFSEVKIDRSFVSEIGSGRDSEIVIRSTISMAHSMDLTVCAEGVETHDALDFLVECGCDTLQGYLISRPVPVEQLAGCRILV